MFEIFGGMNLVGSVSMVKAAFTVAVETVHK